MKTLVDIEKHLKALERRHPTHSDGTGIQITQEAEDMLQPWREALERLDGQTLHYKDTPSPCCITTHHDFNRTTIITEAVWFKAIGDALAGVTEENRLEQCECVRNRDMPNPIIDARVARRVIDSLKVFGISIA